MTFKITPRVRAYRALRCLERYHHLESSDDETPVPRERIQLQVDEIPIGVYENNPGHPADAVVITDQGIHVCSDPRNYFRYDEIQSIGSLDKREHPIAIPIHLRSGCTIELPIHGNDGKLYDSFPFLTFLMRVTEDVAKRTRDERSAQQTPP